MGVETAHRGDTARAAGLLDAAIAVNEAATPAEGYHILAEAALHLVEADRLTVVAFDGESELGTILAEAGTAAAEVEPATVLAVPFAGADGRTTFHVAWRCVLDEHERDEAGHVLHTLTRATPLGKRPPRGLDPQLLQSGRLAAIGELAAGVAHEINNPLFAILGLTEFLLKDAEPGSKDHQRLELIQETGLEIREIVRALLDFARESPEERHDVRLEDVARSTVALVRRTNPHKGVAIVESYRPEPALVHASPNQLKQIFLNLITNARQAMPDGGTIRVEVSRDGDAAVATVADDGPGIAPEVLPRIFAPFFTTKRLTGGTGLGLPVSRGIAETHGGTLTAASEPGRGSTFTLRLPSITAAP